MTANTQVPPAGPGQVSPARRGSSHKRRGGLGRAGVYLLCIVLLVLFLAPIIFSTLTSIKTPAEASAVPPTYIPSTFSLANYQKLNLYGAGIWQYVFNSSTAALLTVFGTILLSTLAGLASRALTFPLRTCCS